MNGQENAPYLKSWPSSLQKDAQYIKTILLDVKRALLPNIAVTVKGETPLIDKLAPFLTAAQLYSPQAFEKKKESGAFWF